MDQDNEECEDCVEFDSYVCQQHRKSISEILDADDGVGTLIYYAFCDEDTGGFASKVYSATKAAEAIYEEGMRRGALTTAKTIGVAPTKPTSKAWNLDARALLEMGATSIDAVTVRGTLEELDKLRRSVEDYTKMWYGKPPCEASCDDASVIAFEKLQQVLSKLK